MFNVLLGLPSVSVVPISQRPHQREKSQTHLNFSERLRVSRQSLNDLLSKRRFLCLTMQKYVIFPTPQSSSFHASGNPSDLSLLFRKSFRNASFCPHESIQKTLGNVPSSYCLTAVRAVRKLPVRERILHQSTIIV